MTQQRIYWKEALLLLQNKQKLKLSDIEFRGELLSIPVSLEFERVGITIPDSQIDFSYNVLQYRAEKDTLVVQILSNREIDFWDEIHQGVFVGYDINGHATLIQINNIHNNLQQLTTLVK